MGRMRDRVKKRAEANKNKGVGSLYRIPEGTDFFKPSAKTYKLDLLPYKVTVDTHPEVEKGEEWFERTIFVHRDLGVDDAARICRRTIKEKCPVCQERKDLMREKDPDNEELIDDLKAKERCLYNVIDLANQDKGVQLWDISYFCFGKQLDEEIREGEDEYADFAELKGGYTLKVRFSEQQLGTNKFVKATRIDFIKRKDYDKDILDEVIDLDKILIIPTEEQLEKELHNVEEDPGDEKKDSKEEKEEKDEEESEEDRKKREIAEERKRRRAEREKREKEEKEDKGLICPSGHEFGVDTDKFEKDCNDCELWVECDDAKEAAAKD